jgi:hypothetical protein
MSGMFMMKFITPIGKPSVILSKTAIPVMPVGAISNGVIKTITPIAEMIEPATIRVQRIINRDFGINDLSEYSIKRLYTIKPLA